MPAFLYYVMNTTRKHTLMRPVLYKCLFIAIVLLLGACAGPSDQMQIFDRSLRAYEHGLRWQDFDVVIAYHKNEHAKLTAERRNWLRRFRISAYNVLYVRVDENETHASQLIEVKYYTDSNLVVRDITLQNEWEFDENSKRWFLTNPLPAFR